MARSDIGDDLIKDKAKRFNVQQYSSYYSFVANLELLLAVKTAAAAVCKNRTTSSWKQLESRSHIFM